MEAPQQLCEHEVERREAEERERVRRADEKRLARDGEDRWDRVDCEDEVEGRDEHERGCERSREHASPLPGPQNGRPRICSRADKGLRALKHYARTPVTFTPLKSEPLLKLLIADLVGEKPTRESLAGLRADIAELERQLDDAEQTAKLLPHRRTYLLLVIGFLRQLFELHLELVKTVERELA